MQTRQLRLNDIIQENEVIVDLDYPDIEEFNDNKPLKNIMYNILIDNYLWAYIAVDNSEQFISWFKVYWNRNIIKYLPLLENQIKISQDKTETPELVDTTTYKLGDTVDITYGRTLNMDGEHTDNQTTKEYETQTVNNQRKYTQKDKNTYGGNDTTVRSGENVQTLNRNGQRTFKVVDKGNETVTYYDVDKFVEIIKSTNLLDKFIDEFAPLFMEVLFYM